MKTSKKLALAAACLMLAGPALAEETTTDTITDKAKSVGESTGVNSLIGAAPTTKDFVSMVAISDLFELESSKLAAERGSEQTKAFAKQMIEDHTKTTGDIKGLVKAGKVPGELPSALDSAHQSKLDTLKGLKGADFDKQYQSDQVSAHKTAVDLFQRYAESGENADLKAWAAKTKPHLEEHLKKAEALGGKS